MPLVLSEVIVGVLITIYTWMVHPGMKYGQSHYKSASVYTKAAYPQSIHRRMRVKFKRGDLVNVAAGYMEVMSESYRNKVGVVVNVEKISHMHIRTTNDVYWPFNGQVHPFIDQALVMLAKARE